MVSDMYRRRTRRWDPIEVILWCGLGTMSNVRKNDQKDGRRQPLHYEIRYLVEGPVPFLLPPLHSAFDRMT